MKRTVVRYKAKPEQDGGERAADRGGVPGTARESRRRAFAIWPCGLADGTFVHFVAVDPRMAAITGLEAFRSFRSGINERCIEPPQAGEATIVGNYRMLGEHERRIGGIGRCERRDIRGTHERLSRRHGRNPRGLRSAARRVAAEAASLLRPHDRLGHRRRGCGPGSAGEGDRGVSRSADRSPIRKAGCFASPTMRRWIFCAAAPGRRRLASTRIRT